MEVTRMRLLCTYFHNTLFTDLGKQLKNRIKAMSVKELAISVKAMSTEFLEICSDVILGNSGC